MTRYDAVVVGSGPNGLAAAVTIARAGGSVLVIEAADRIGGGTRTEELTLPGFRHDVCSAIHPYGPGSPFLRTLPLADHGLQWVHPELPMAHALTPDRVAVLHRDLDETVEAFGADGPAYRKVMQPIVESWPQIESHVFGPLVSIPRHPLAMARFGLSGAPSARLAARRFHAEEVRGLFAGLAAHAFLPLDRPLTASFGWFLLAGAHVNGWPAARGGSQAIADALASLLRSLGGEIVTGHRVTSLDELPDRRATLLDLTPEGLDDVAGDALPSGYRRRLRGYRRGPAAFKVDLALDGPVPWAHPDLARAGTVHIGGTFETIAEGERRVWEGRRADPPFVLIAQQSRFDPTRAPEGKETLWAYAHVPHASTDDVTDTILDRIEEHAPGFSTLVAKVHTASPAWLEQHNPNYRGGDIAAGAHTIPQLLFRPFPSLSPYATPLPGVFLCSAATPPGAGAHGMCGYNAARRALSWMSR